MEVSYKMKHSVTIWPSNATPGYIPKKITTQIIHAAQCSQLHYLQEPGHGSNLTWQHQKVNSCCTETPLLDIPEGHWWWENIPVSRTLTIAPGYSIYSGEMDRCVNIYPFIGFGQWFGGMFKAFEGKWLEIDDKEICKRVMLIVSQNGHKHEDTCVPCECSHTHTHTNIYIVTSAE